MVNPLARVVMNNVIKNTKGSKSYAENNKITNLTSKDEEMLKGIINRDRQINNYEDKPNILTLDEAVKMIKDGR